MTGSPLDRHAVQAAAVSDHPPPSPGVPATLVLSRTVLPGHEQAFEAVLHRLAAEVRALPGRQGVTVLRPQPGGPDIYTIIAHFARRQDMKAWLSSGLRARLVAEADLHAAGSLRTRYLSGLEGWLVQPGSAVVLPTAHWKIAVVSAAGIVPLLEAVTCLLAPRLARLPEWSRALIFVVLLIRLLQYVVMPVLTRAARGFLCQAPAAVSPGGAP
jgi:antibiotic biosynthesis monooxygenase (ABM) superfamily enzyme